MNKYKPLLDKIKHHRQYQVLKQAGLVIDQSTVTRKTGLHIGPRQVDFISESLRRESLPQTKVPHKIKDKNGQEIIVYYHIIAGIREQNAIDILKNDHSLDHLRTNPVTQMPGQEQNSSPIPLSS